MTNKPATIYDVAKKAELSANTVSRVLRDKNYIAKETRDRVLKAVQELNYSPNRIASSLRRSKTMQVLLAVPYIWESFNFKLIAAVQDYVQKCGYSLVLMYTNTLESMEVQAISNLECNHADALILLTVNPTPFIIQRLEKTNKPCVLCSVARYEGDKAIGVDYVCTDTEYGIYLSANHLIAQGYSSLFYIGPRRDTIEGYSRLSGFRAAVREAGLDTINEYIETGGHDESFGYECGKKIAAMKSRPTAVCAATDLIVLGLYKAFGENCIKVPEEIAVTGMDDIDICIYAQPKITSVSILQDKLGLLAAEMVMDRIASNDRMDYKNITLKPDLIIRESSIR